MSLTSARVTAADERAAQELFLQQGWTDGLPIVAPTEDAVSSFVSAVGLAPDTVLGSIPEQGRDITVEKLAVNAVMAGAHHEYMSLLAATVRALTRSEFNLHSTTVSGATAPLLLISGPVVAKLNINSSFSVFGPGYHANATIGRTVRLLLQNVCGGVPGIVDKSTMGHPGKFSYCIGESAEHNPWGPLHTDRGVNADSAVTVFAGEGPINARNDWATEPDPILATIADAMLPSHYTGGSFVVVLGPMHAATMARAGLDRSAVATELQARARRSVADLKRAGRLRGPIDPHDEHEYLPAAQSPAHILVTVAGGHLYGYSAVLPSWVGGHESTPVTEPVSD